MVSINKNLETLKAGVIGYPIAQSLSPLIHNHWMRQLAILGDYSAIEVAPDALERAIDTFKRQDFCGWNVTVPHKTNIVQYMDTLAPLARTLGAVNTVKVDTNGHLTGFNTDVAGFMDHLQASAPDWPRDKPVLVLGAGGAARAAIMGLINQDVPFVMICNRTRPKAEDVAARLGRDRVTVVNWGDRNEAATSAGLIVNTTVLGMQGSPALDLDLSGAGKDTVVYDIVYKPLETPLIKQARSHGLQMIDGLGMLVGQAAAAFHIWFGITPNYDKALKTKLLSELGEGS